MNKIIIIVLLAITAGAAVTVAVTANNERQDRLAKEQAQKDYYKKLDKEKREMEERSAAAMRAN